MDTLAPTVSSITFSDTVLKIGDTATVTIVLSEKENIGTFTAADITTPNGVLSALSTADNITFTGTFTPNAATEVASNVAVVGTDWADYNGNLASLGISSANYIVDTIAPIVNIS